MSADGEPYNRLPNAHKFEQSYDTTCSCRRPGKSWAEALAYAEARFGRSARDIVVTLEKSQEMSRPIEDPKARLLQANAAKTDATDAVEGADSASIELDLNRVDTRLAAAAAAISRETSGIKGGETLPGAHYGLKEGRIVGQTAPNGSSRRVRIVAPMF